MRVREPLVHVSVVSHGHGPLVAALLEGLAAGPAASRLAVTLTLNVPEPLAPEASEWPLHVDLLHNVRPRGFGANHNAAFHRQEESRRSRFFCVLNPDTVVSPDALVALAGRLGGDPRLGAIAPLVRDPSGLIEDSMRRVPTPAVLLRKLLGGHIGNEYRIEGSLYHPDWIAGICMVFPSRLYAQMGGFDERYWLYYEDVDLCCRVRARGYEVAVDPSVSITHDARRASRSNPRMLALHLRSIARFFTSAVYWQCRRLSRARSAADGVAWGRR